MASIAFPSLAKKATLSDGTTYGYVAVAPSSIQKATFLLLHGYPSSSHDWRYQIAGLQEAGYGVIAPDLLGYGDTDKPVDLGAYLIVAHDWGVGLASRLVTYERHRFLGLVTIAVSYVEPGLEWDISAICMLTKKLIGYETYGYWKWHNTDEAVTDNETHPASAFNLVYPHDPLLWKTDFAPSCKAAEFVRAGRTTPLPSWYSLTDYTIRDRIFAKGGYAGPLSWYKSAMRGTNSEDEAEVPDEDKLCPVPNLFIAAKHDYVCREDLQSELARKWVPHGKIETVNCGHWVQLEEPELLNRLLIDFVEGLTVKK